MNSIELQEPCGSVVGISWRPVGRFLASLAFSPCRDLMGVNCFPLLRACRKNEGS